VVQPTQKTVQQFQVSISMDARSEDSIRAEIAAIDCIPYVQRSTDDKKRLNALEDEIRLRHSVQAQSGKYILQYCCLWLMTNIV